MLEDLEKLSQIVASGKIEENIDFIKKEIPEIENMIGFEHRHPHHHLDVWNHTLEVVKNINSQDLELKMAALLHDIGKPFSYQDEEVRHFHGHPEVSEKMSKNILKRLGYSENFIINVCYLVRNHDTVIDPQNLDNSYKMVMKRLELQYADAKAHAPGKVEKRLNFLDSISKSLERKEEREI